MSDALLEAVTIEPEESADACVVWLHGLGADGYDFVNVIPSLNLPEKHRIRFVFPHAPSRPVTINNGVVMPAWYDITALDLHAQQDEDGLKTSEVAIQALLAQIVAGGIPSERIILMGFSQGGALSLFSALRYHAPLAGVAALSAYLPLHNAFPFKEKKQAFTLKLFMAHGLMDPVVPYWLGQQSCQSLQALGYQPQWESYPMPHTVCLQELNDIGAWMQECLN